MTNDRLASVNYMYFLYHHVSCNGSVFLFLFLLSHFSRCNSLQRCYQCTFSYSCYTDTYTLKMSGKLKFSSPNFIFKLILEQVPIPLAIPVPGHHLPLATFLVNHRSVHIIENNTFWLVPEAKMVSHSFSFLFGK